jgi:hypothetical protein
MYVRNMRVLIGLDPIGINTRFLKKHVQSSTFQATQYTQGFSKAHVLSHPVK